MNQRGFVLVEFVIALPLLIFLLYALGNLTFKAMKISREQVADYALETEAQEIIDRITTDARTACYVKIESITELDPNLENVSFKCHTLDAQLEGYRFKIDEDGDIFQYRKVDEENEVEPYHIDYYKNILDSRIYAIHSTQAGLYHVYFKRQDDNNYNNPITGDNSFGNTLVTQMKFSVPAPKVLHITFEMKSIKREQKVKFSTAVYMPSCEKINDKGTIYEYE